MESNSVCNHTSDNKIGRPRSGSPICLSRVKVWFQGNKINLVEFVVVLLAEISVISEEPCELFSRFFCSQLIFYFKNKIWPCSCFIRL